MEIILNVLGVIALSGLTIAGAIALPYIPVAIYLFFKARHKQSYLRRYPGRDYPFD